MKVNGHLITYSPLYDKFQVWMNGRCLEEFRALKDAIRFAEDN